MGNNFSCVVNWFILLAFVQLFYSGFFLFWISPKHVLSLTLLLLVFYSLVDGWAHPFYSVEPWTEREVALVSFKGKKEKENIWIRNKGGMR